MPRLGGIFVFALLVYLAMGAGMYLVQRKLQYFPGTEQRTPQSVGVSGVDVITIATPDGETLLAWHIPAPPGQPTILFLHGNGGSIADRPLKISTYAQAGFGVLALSYRGYPGSTGSPSEQGLVTDALAAYDWLAARPNSGIMVVGESLGTAVSVQLAAQRDVKALALEAPLASAVEIGANAYWWLPVRLLMKDQYRSIEHIETVKAPLLIQHGKRDTLIAYEQGEKLFAAANEPKQFVSYQNEGHNLIAVPEVWQREIEFFKQQ